MIRILFFILIVMSLSAFAQISTKPEARMIDEFGFIIEEDFNARFNSIYLEIRDNTSVSAIIINYGSSNKIRRNERFIERCFYDYKIDRTRIKVINGGYLKEAKTQFWIILAGADLPKLIPAAYKFDEFGKISERQWKRKLDKFAEKITCSQENSFYVVIYPTKKTNLNNLKKRYLDRLVRLRCIDPPRIILAEGSVQKVQKTELWIVPPGAEAPAI